MRAEESIEVVTAHSVERGGIKSKSLSVFTSGWLSLHEPPPVL
jgi:hypothetical protein